MSINIFRERDWYFTIVENAILDDLGLTSYEKLGIVALSRFADSKTGECYPSYSTLAAIMKCSRSTVQKTIESLCEKGYIRKRNNVEGTEHKSNTYVIKSQYEIIKKGIPPHGIPIPPDGTGGIPPDGTPIPPHGNELEPYNYNHNELYKNSASDDAVFVPAEKPTGGAQGKTGKDEYTADFEAFWKVYPRRREKRRAWRVWQARIKEKVQPSVLITAARAYAASCKGTEERFLKHAATFLGPDRPFEEYASTAKNEPERGQYDGLFDD